MRMPRVRLIVILSAFTAASLERASTLEEWLGAMTLDPGVDFETTIAGTSLEITDLTCEDLKITGALAASYEAPRALRATVAGVEAECEGKYEWSYRLFGQKVSGDGRVTGDLRDAALDVRLDFGADGRGAPTTVAIGACAAAVTLDGVKLRGDALGSLLDGFTDAIVGFYDEQIADAICAALADAVSADLAGISPSCEAGAAPETPDAARALAETPAYVDWAHLLANGTGPGAAVARAANRLRRGRRFEGGDVFGLLLDVGKRLGLPLASATALDLGGLGVATVGGAGPERARLAVSVAAASLTAASRAGQEKGAKFPTSKAPISAVFHSFRLIFGRAIIFRNGLEA